MSCKMSLEEICSMVESSVFDRKSAKIDAKSLAVHLIAFANADGGTLAIGVEDDGEITGIDGYAENINELLRAPFDFCKPSVQVETKRIPCKNAKGLPDHILLIEVLQSNDIHANQADEVFFRIGDKSKKLNFDERLQLMYSKGTRYFEDAPVPDATMDDIDLDFVREYTAKLGYRKSAQEYLLENKEFIKEKNGRQEVSAAAVLLFGKNPKHFFPRARIRFIRYEGTEARVGAAMNVIKDVTFDGRILEQIQKTVEYLETQVKEHSYLGEDGIFKTDREYPKFVIQEMVVNSVCHRDYSIKGTEIQIKMFDDRLVFETPGKLPGIVRTDNIRHTHFSRNPKIAEFLKAYDYVKEFGEGVDRMCRELSALGVKEPQYNLVAFIMKATVCANILEEVQEANHSDQKRPEADQLGHNKGITGAQQGHNKILSLIAENPQISISALAKQCEVSEKAMRITLERLKAENIIKRVGPSYGGHWEILLSTSKEIK